MTVLSVEFSARVRHAFDELQPTAGCDCVCVRPLGSLTTADERADGDPIFFHTDAEVQWRTDLSDTQRHQLPRDEDERALGGRRQVVLRANQTDPVTGELRCSSSGAKPKHMPDGLSTYRSRSWMHDDYCWVGTGRTRRCASRNDAPIAFRWVSIAR